MKVKCTETFRKFYKSNIKETKDENRNPHFAGRAREIDGNNEYGFFELFHGNGGEMQNLLKTILQMARDSQALYEFLQNAVDAKSEDFLMFHHHSRTLNQDYLIVLNNGRAFDLQGVLSILDIAASTKFGDADTIGQFGVGFKLAHRLVGEDAGLEELLEENKGPILFSWQHSELHELSRPSTSIEPDDPLLEGRAYKAKCLSETPWLFKILYTNFPCLPGENIIDAKNRPINDAFTSGEVDLLKEVAAVCINEKIKTANFEEGTLLLIPLHPGKITEVTQSANADGLPITAAILNNRKGHQILQRVVLNADDLQASKVEFESFKIDVAALDKIELENDDQRKYLKGIKQIEFDLCFGDPFGDIDLFKGRPQFYLYFPMTEERHGFRFALHCNSFSFTAARTALQDNTHRNQLLFQLFADKLHERLHELYETKRERFIILYASLILSKRGQGSNEWKTNREWLENEFWSPLMNTVRRFIPVKDGSSWRLATESEHVLIKDSALPLEEWTAANERWFYWNAKEQPILCTLAEGKLSLTRKNFIDVLLGADSLPVINEWLAADTTNSKRLLTEVNDSSIFVGRTDKEKDTFWNHFKQLKLWHFSNVCYSAIELNQNDDKRYLIQYGPLVQLSPALQKAGFLLSVEVVDEYPSIAGDIRSRLSGEVNYLRNYENLCSLLSTQFAVANLFTAAEKKEIFNTLLAAIRASSQVQSRISILRVLALFANGRGTVKPLQALIGRKNLVPPHLDVWKIDETEAEGVDVEEYTANEKHTIYQQVLVPEWDNIVQSEELTRDARLEFFKYVADCYSSRAGMQVLSHEKIRFSASGLVPAETPFFYHPNLDTVEKTGYLALENAFEKMALGKLPQRNLLPFYKSVPFQLPPQTNLSPTINEKSIVLTQEEVQVFLPFAVLISPGFFQSYRFQLTEGEQIAISKLETGLRPCFHKNTSICHYIDEYCRESLYRVPAKIERLGSQYIVHGEELVNELITNVPENALAIRELLVLLRELGGDGQKEQLLAKLTPIDLSHPVQHDSLEKEALLLCFSISGAETRRFALEKLLTLSAGDVTMLLGSIEKRGSDLITIQVTEEWAQPFSIAELLGGKENETNSRLTDVAMQWKDMGIASLDVIESALGIHKHREIEKVFKELQQETGNILNNGAQLAFVMLVAQRTVSKLRDWVVQTVEGPQPLRNGDFYLYSDSNAAFIPSRHLLDSVYNSAADFLHLTTSFSFDVNGTRINLKPFLKNETLQLPGIERIDGETQKNSLLQFLYALWTEAGKPGTLKHSGGDWQPFIGLSVNTLIVVDDYALPSETLNYQSLPIHGDDMLAFLKALGAQGEGSGIVEVRKFFKRSGGSLVGQRALGKKQVQNTLLWISRNGLTVSNSEIVAFYEPALYPTTDPLPPLPCFLPGKNGLFIVEDVTTVQLLSSEHKEAIIKKDIDIQGLANLAKVPIVTKIECLSGLFPRLQSTLQTLDIKWNEIDIHELRKQSTLWNSPFYAAWQQGQKRPVIKLFDGEMPRKSFVNSLPFYRSQSGESTFDSEFNTYYVNGQQNPAQIIQELKKYSLHQQAWLELETEYQKQDLRMHKLFAKASINSKLFERLDRMLDEIEISEERLAKARLVNDKKAEYTFQWFMYLLDLVKAQERRVGIPDISFEKCEQVPGSEQVYELSEASRNIPIDIDSHDQITATVTYLAAHGVYESLTTALEASYKYRKVWVRFLAPLPPSVTPATIKDVRLSFTKHVDLVQELRSGFNRLGYAPTQNLKTTLTHRVEFLFGPPGTGKTTILANSLIDAMDGKRERIIVLVPTNKAADVLCQKIVEKAGGPPDWLIRTGNCTDPRLLLLGIVKPSQEIYLDESSGCVVITTIHRFAYQTIWVSHTDTSQTRLSDCPWSMVVFDEASMIPLPYITYAIHQRQVADKETRFLVAGDPLQIPPVFELIADDLEEAEELQLQNIYTMVGLNSFVPDEQKKDCSYGKQEHIRNLQKQHRSIPVIGQLVSQFQYDGRVTPTRGTPDNPRSAEPRALPRYFQEVLNFKPLTIIRFPVRDGDTIYNPRKINASPLHLYSSLLISELVKRFRQEVNAEQHAPWSLGILSPYRAQAGLIGKMIEAHPHQSSRLKVTTDTVHGFQGDETTMVFAVLNPSNPNVFYSLFLKKPYIINVAISRAEDYLVLFIPDDKSEGIGNLPLIQQLQSIIRHLPQQDHIIELQAKDVEEKIMGKRNYFENNSFATNHQPVNVYGIPHLPYVMRINDSAIDIHWEQ